MSPHNLTTWFLVLWIAQAVLWDVWACARWGADGTISRVALYHCQHEPILALAVGVVIGHVFWRMP